MVHPITLYLKSEFWGTGSWFSSFKLRFGMCWSRGVHVYLKGIKNLDPILELTPIELCFEREDSSYWGWINIHEVIIIHDSLQQRQLRRTSAVFCMQHHHRHHHHHHHNKYNNLSLHTVRNRVPNSTSPGRRFEFQKLWKDKSFRAHWGCGRLRGRVSTAMHTPQKKLRMIKVSQWNKVNEDWNGNGGKED